MITDLIKFNNNDTALEPKEELKMIAQEIRAIDEYLNMVERIGAVKLGQLFRRAKELCEKINYSFGKFCKETTDYGETYIRECIKVAEKLGSREDIQQMFSDKKLRMIAANASDEMLADADSNGFKMPDGDYISFDSIQNLPNGECYKYLKNLAKRYASEKGSYDREKARMKETLDAECKKRDDIIKELSGEIGKYHAKEIMHENIEVANEQVLKFAGELSAIKDGIAKNIDSYKHLIKASDFNTKAILDASLSSIATYINKTRQEIFNTRENIE